MAQTKDILECLPAPAVLLDARGGALAANALFDRSGADRTVLTRLKPGERVETADGGGGWIWRVQALDDGERLVTAERAAPSALTNRERYLAALSHELRTPLNGVLGMAGLLAGTLLDADQRSYVTALRESGEHLLGLVNDVLDLAKLESGRLDLEPHPVDVERLLQGVAELLSPRAFERNLEIAWTAPPGLPAVLADDGRLRQILFNLAGNAVKFTEAGGVLLSVSAAPTQKGLRLRFSVADTGPGVPQADQARVFEEFARLEGPHRRLEGAGLGLAIVRRLAQAHDGAVGLRDRDGGGAEFWFEADFAVASPAQAADSLKGRAVTVVSASPIVRDAAVGLVEAGGGAALAFDALASAAEAAPDGAVLLIDYPVMKAAGSLKPPAGRAAIVLLAPEQRGLIARCRKAGFGGYLIKPLRRASVAERVLAVLGHDSAVAPAPVEDERASITPALGLKVLLAEDNPINALLARSLLERQGCQVSRAANGEEAVQAACVADFDLILMDLRMPVVDGLQAARALRARGITTPIVALTADAFEDDRKACLAAGMNDFLSKPLDPAALRVALGRWAGGARVPVRMRRAS